MFTRARRSERGLSSLVDRAGVPRNRWRRVRRRERRRGGREVEEALTGSSYHVRRTVRDSLFQPRVFIKIEFQYKNQISQAYFLILNQFAAREGNTGGVRLVPALQTVYRFRQPIDFASEQWVGSRKKRGYNYRTSKFHL
jgi:hypothetical protein